MTGWAVSGEGRAKLRLASCIGAMLVAVGGSASLLLFGFAWWIPGPVWGYPTWLRVPGSIMFLAAIPVGVVAVASMRLLLKSPSRAGDGATPTVYRIRSSLIPDIRTILTRWLGAPAWLVLAGGYLLLAFNGFQQGLNLGGDSRPGLIGAVLCSAIACWMVWRLVGPHPRLGRQATV